MASALAHRATTHLALHPTTHLALHQLGVGVRGGCEAILHPVGQVLEEDPGQWLLQGDIISAFNLADRDASFREVEDVFPECLDWVPTSYGASSNLQYSSTTIFSETSFHQGDPLASIMFSLLLHPVVKTQDHPGRGP